MKKIILMILVFCTVFNCKKDNKSIGEYFSTTDTCHLKEFDKYLKDSIWNPSIIFSVDDYILLYEPKLDTLVSVFNISTYEYKKIIRKSNGPDELIDISQIGLYTDSTIFLKSTFNDNLMLLPYENFSIKRTVKSPQHSEYIFCDDGLFIYSQRGNNRFALDDSVHNVHQEFGEFLSIFECSQEMLSKICDGFCVGSRKNKRFAWAFMSGEAIEIYDYSDLKHIKLVKQFTGITPFISINNNIPAFSVKSKLGFMSLTCNDNYIYALYSDNYFYDFTKKGEDALMCNKILVYDWEGMPIKILQTDKNIRSISCNEKYNRVFCVGHDNNKDSKIFYFNCELNLNKSNQHPTNPDRHFSFP